MEGKYAVKLSITELIKINRKLRKHYNGRLWKMQMWSDSCIPKQVLVLTLILWWNDTQLTEAFKQISNIHTYPICSYQFISVYSLVHILVEKTKAHVGIILLL